MNSANKKDILVRTLHTFLNPFERERVLPLSSNMDVRAIQRMGALALGWGGLTVGLRYLAYKYEMGNREKDAAKIRAYLGAKYPVISIDPFLEDLKKERKLQELGVSEQETLPELEEEKEGQDGYSDAHKSYVKGLVKGPFDIVSEHIKSEESPLHLSLALAGVILGSIGGWGIFEKVTETSRLKTLKDRLEKQRNLLDKQLYEELKETRGFGNKNAADSSFTRGEVMSGGGRGISGAITTVAQHPIATLSMIESLWWVWALSTFAIGYSAGKKYSDKFDNSRERMRQLKFYAREKAKMRDFPVLLEGGPGISAEEERGEEPKKPRSVAPARIGQSIPSTMKEFEDKVRKMPADVSDPYAALLSGEIR